VTLGSRGALVLDRGRLEHVPGRRVEPTVDPTGAGDAFGAAYLTARAAGNGPAGAARRACGLVADLLSGRLR
jgi:2-dehydro-3-deoxygluconokinase